jgi:hypothetical protein
MHSTLWYGRQWRPQRQSTAVRVRGHYADVSAKFTIQAAKEQAFQVKVRLAMPKARGGPENLASIMSQDVHRSLMFYEKSMPTGVAFEAIP